LLAANCGFTQVDLANLKLEEIIKIKGEWYIRRQRDKTSHQNDFFTTWYLWPETAELLQKHKAGKNPQGLALLRPNGQSLQLAHHTYVDEQLKRVEKPFSFKQFRKFGGSAIMRLTKNRDTQRKYLAQAIDGAAAHYDSDDFFDDLTEALKMWHKELRKEKVLEAGK
jgi:integrase